MPTDPPVTVAARLVGVGSSPHTLPEAEACADALARRRLLVDEDGVIAHVVPLFGDSVELDGRIVADPDELARRIVDACRRLRAELEEAGRAEVSDG